MKNKSLRLQEQIEQNTFWGPDKLPLLLRFCLLLQSRALLTAAESKLAEAKRQYDMMLESKQLELSRHLKEISQRNDQVLSLTIFLT